MTQCVCSRCVLVVPSVVLIHVPFGSLSESRPQIPPAAAGTGDARKPTIRVLPGTITSNEPPTSRPFETMPPLPAPPLLLDPPDPPVLLEPPEELEPPPLGPPARPPVTLLPESPLALRVGSPFGFVADPDALTPPPLPVPVGSEVKGPFLSGESLLGPVRVSLPQAVRTRRMAGMAAVRGWRMVGSFDGVPACGRRRASSVAGLSTRDP